MKKAQGISINVIVVAAIALIVMVVLVIIFTGRVGKFGKTTSETEQNVEDQICLKQGGFCEEFCPPGTSPLNAPVGGWLDCGNNCCK